MKLIITTLVLLMSINLFATEIEDSVPTLHERPKINMCSGIIDNLEDFQSCVQVNFVIIELTYKIGGLRLCREIDNAPRMFEYCVRRNFYRIADNLGLRLRACRYLEIYPRRYQACLNRNFEKIYSRP